MAETKDENQGLAKGTSSRGTDKSGRAPREVAFSQKITSRDVGRRVVIRLRFGVRSLVVTAAMVGRTFGETARYARMARVADRTNAIFEKSQRARGAAGPGFGPGKPVVAETRLIKYPHFGYGGSRDLKRVARTAPVIEEVLVPTAHHGMLRVSVASDGSVRVADRPRRVTKRIPKELAHESPAGPAVAEAFTTAQMLEAGVLAFWKIAERWNLSNAEQCAMLQVSDSTRLRWKRSKPTEGDTLLDRLQLVLLAYQRANELAGSEAESAALLRREGSALNAELPQQTILEMLSVPSILEMNRHFQRLESEVAAW